LAFRGISDMTGSVLAGRYRLLAPIGTGASGKVYVADDVRLKRQVAVKVLHAALSDDAGFLRRFRAEAQVAASLHHPNIVSVYDWGEDDVPFMVLELLEGGSLRAMLDRGIRLTPAQAAHVGSEVCAALEYAHARGLVHRDVKPANLLFDEHGIVRVADFGLARALAEASWTEPAGAVIGTARYASPEQATGAPLDARSDLYALGLVLVESVTGNVPFAADTALGTLAARTQSSVPAPAELGPLAPVVERACRVTPAERYPDAVTMGDALGDAIDAMPLPGPLTLVGAGEITEDPHPTQLGLTREQQVYDQDDGGKAKTTAASRKRSSDSHDRRTGWVVAVVAIVVLLAVITTGIVVLAPGGHAETSVPNLVGTTKEIATARASRAGLKVETVVRTGNDPVGVVVSQQPAAGVWTKSSGVRLVLSKGPPPVLIPDVTKMSVADATKRLQDLGFTVSPQNPYNDTVPKGSVIGTDPAAGQGLKAESGVALLISNGPTPVKVPDVSGQPNYATASDQITHTSPGFTTKESDDYSDTVPQGTVIGSTPPANTMVQPPAVITISVSKGPQLIPIPNLVGQTVESAAGQLTALGLSPSVPVLKPGQPVVGMNPAPGSPPVKKGTTVQLFQ
jgi:beta-lactam-binding protein with PASTA domain/tRNA A-37 threonylcarbamoyl transferase component Bud32